jgi:hypothetical protein
MISEDLARVYALPFESAVERALRNLVAASAGVPPVRDSHAWRLASVVATERDPSDSLMREALACLCEELEAHGAAARSQAYLAAQKFTEMRLAAA